MKPKIICHMMSSVDGRLIGDRWSLPFDGKKRDDLYEPYFELSKEQNADGWMVGRSTIQTDNPVGTFDWENHKPTSEFKTFIGKRDSERMCIVIDPKGKILYHEDTLDGDNIVAILGETVSEEYLAMLRDKGISYLFAGLAGTELEIALDTLYTEFGMRKIMLSGGGIINGTFLVAGLIDELILMIYPGIDALSSAPSIFEYPGQPGSFPAKSQALELLSTRTERDGIITLHYKFHKL
ncbi:MAG: dihydrofolate reductase family protein [Oscillospiraceae bacterium]|nr:dihydrofolate reductase family protein [Oscillospiraceae bacterium]